MSAVVVGWFDFPGPWIIEGVTALRALRKWLKAHKEGKPCDIVYFFMCDHGLHSTGLVNMAKTQHKIWVEIRDELTARGIELKRPRPWKAE